MSKRPRPDESPQDFGFLDSVSDVQPDTPGIIGNERQSGASQGYTSETIEPVSQSVVPSQPIVGSPKSEKKSLAAKANPQTPQHATDGELPDVNERGPASGVSGKLFPILLGYAIFVTVLLVYLMITGKSSRLESLPDLRPLKGNEFQQVPEGTELPNGHVLNLGQSVRFGDVVVTPLRITREALKFENFMTKAANDGLTTPAVLRLHFTMKNVSHQYAFPPYDAGLMSHRSPPDSEEDSTKANSFLLVKNPYDSTQTRVLNYLQSMDNPFLLVGQNSARIIRPGETMDTFVASSTSINSLNLNEGSEYVWRVQIRKGVHQKSGNGVTTLIDVVFKGSDVEAI